MAVLRLLQISDLHLGRPFGWLSPERRADRRSDQRRALDLAVRQAIERGVHAILLPGDLFDREYVDGETLAHAVHAFAVSGCPPVFIAPGNHDPYAETSAYWNAALLKARGFSWPAHVRVFDAPEWTPVPLAGVDAVRVWGRCSIQGVASAARPFAPGALARVAAERGAGLDIALLHGTREGHLPPGEDPIAPFTDAECLQAPFDYVAAGHLHAPQTLAAPGETDGAVRLAYAGGAVALDVSETGGHGAWDVSIDVASRRVTVEFVELDRRRVYELVVDVTGATAPEQVDRRILRALDQAGAGDADILAVRLTGRLVRGVRYAAPGPELRPRAFHVRVDARAVRPDYDLDALRTLEPVTTEDRFARALLAQLDAETDPAARAELEAALTYGLDAFRLHEVVPSGEAPA